MEPATGLWAGVLRIIDRAPGHAQLSYHGVAALAVTHWRRTGRPVPVELAGVPAAQAAMLLELERLVPIVRGATDQPMVLLKGFDVAARYPDPALRRMRDVDVLTADPDAMQRELLAAGWRKETGEGIALDERSYQELHHLCPLQHRDLSLPLEVHRAPHWPTSLAAPTFEEIRAEARPSRIGVAGVLTPCAEHHALMVLAHAWARQPFEQLSQLLDFALLLECCDAARLAAVARRWGMRRLLDIGRRTVDSVFLECGRDPYTVRLFACHLRTLTVPSGRRRQLDRYGASAVVSSPLQAVRAAGAGVSRRVRTNARERRARARLR